MVTKAKAYYVYILQCKNGSYYTGSTSNLTKRVKLHNSGHGAKYLANKLPVVLVYAKEYKHYKYVRHAERNLKKLARKQKEELIEIYKRSKPLPTDCKTI